jgi:hypothetical protein
MKASSLGERLMLAARMLCEFGTTYHQKLALFYITLLLRKERGDGPWNELPGDDGPKLPKLQVIHGGRNREVQS